MAAGRNENGPGGENGNAKSRARDVHNDHVIYSSKLIAYYTAGHLPCTDSAYYLGSRKALHQIVGTVSQPFFVHVQEEHSCRTPICTMIHAGQTSSLRRSGQVAPRS